MSRFPETAPVLSGGFVLLEPSTGLPHKTIRFQFNPDSVTRTLQPQGIGGEAGDRLEALRLKGPAQETYKFDAEFDAADQLGEPAQHPREATHGIAPVLSALELSIYPTTDQLTTEDRLAGQGMIEVAPMESSLLVLVLGPRRVLPVRLTELTVAEEAFDTSLDPIRAKVSIGVRVLTVDDLGFRHKGGTLYLQYHRQKERWSALVTDPAAVLGVTRI